MEWIDQKFYFVQNLLKDCKGTLLDLGSRDQILKKFINDEIEYEGYDKEQNDSKTNIIVNLENELPFSDNSYDYVTILDVAEHLENPLNLIKKCEKIYRKKLLIVLPNIAYYEFRFKYLIAGNLGLKYHFSGKKEDDRHKWFTNYFLINSFFDKNFKNYQIIKISKTRNKLKFLNYIEVFLGKFFPNFFCWSFLIVFEK